MTIRPHLYQNIHFHSKSLVPYMVEYHRLYPFVLVDLLNESNKLKHDQNLLFLEHLCQWLEDFQVWYHGDRFPEINRFQKYLTNQTAWRYKGGHSDDRQERFLSYKIPVRYQNLTKMNLFLKKIVVTNIFLYKISYTFPICLTGKISICIISNSIIVFVNKKVAFFC